MSFGDEWTACSMVGTCRLTNTRPLSSRLQQFSVFRPFLSVPFLLATFTLAFTPVPGVFECNRIFAGDFGQILQTTSDALPNESVEQQTEDPPEDVQIAGSRLLTPASFGFTNIPTAVTERTNIRQVETVDEFGNPVVARVHVKVGENFVVMLPNGQLVGRLKENVQATDREFKAASHREIANEVLEHRLDAFSNMKFEKSRHYVFLHNTTPEFKAATRGILESMFSGVERFVERMGIETHDPAVPLVVIMFNTEREFQAYRPMPPGVVAYYDMVSNHIVMHEDSAMASTRPDLAYGQLISTIAHEGAHQILHNIGLQQRLSLWPQWLSEGLAEFFAPTELGKRQRWKGAAKVNDLRMFDLETYLQTKYIEGFDGSTIEKAVTDRQLDSTGYATAWSIVHFLHDRKRKAFESYVRQLSYLQPMRGMAAAPDQPVVDNLIHFTSFFGEDMQATETELVDYLLGLDYWSPDTHFIHYVGMAIVPVEDGTRKYACFFTSEEMVEEWRQVLKSHLTPEQIRGAQWEVQEVNDRKAATNLIRRFKR